ncbi:MAG: M20/M25/M40 family metallo-hydrolase [Thermoleophilia bacterium]|nr:M20/M25/M40 family metallo-hydrolase [Thermoleophilia bacterium]
MDVRDRVLTRVEALRDDAISLLGELVRVNSTTPTQPGVQKADVIGGETRVNEILKERYEGAGLETHWVAEDPERRNLVGVRAGAGGGRSLALNAHVDTVAAVDPDRWLCGSPWNPEIRDGRLYGLGSTDMKGSGVAMWAAAQALEDEGVRLAGELQLHSVIGEEMMEHHLGTTAVVRAGFRTDAAIVTEPTSYPRPLTVSPVAAGVWILRVVVHGKTSHAGNRPLTIRPGSPGGGVAPDRAGVGRWEPIGVNALEKGLLVVEWLQQLERQWGLTKSHPHFSPGFFTIGPNVLHSDAGVPFPAYIPDRAAIEYVIWYPPQEDAADVARQIEDHVLTASKLDIWLAEHPPAFEWLNNWPPMETPWEHPLVQTVVSAHERISGQAVPPPSPEHPVNFGAASDGSFYEDEGIPSVVYGPGNLEIAHGRDEHVELDEVMLAARVLAAAAIDWCGLG